MECEQIVFVVDDDAEALASVCALVRSMGLACRQFPSGEAFLEHCDRASDLAGCLVTDVRMVGISGIELQEQLQERGIKIPVIVLTAFARTPITVRAMQSGAMTMLDKPYDDDDLWDAIREGLKRDAEQRAEAALEAEIRRQLESLTPSERQVLDLVVAGLPNKVIASRLDVSVRTVENRRREVFVKMQANSVADLVRRVVQITRK
ncbi:MAG: response regulator transcription factor [Planctomycetaceae bacterium]|nr:response regulator transcription factor [Planctomycetales bacterium]MCB9923530.1 response regulator transcription factor [Planctomycetaceae bacterium]